MLTRLLPARSARHLINEICCSRGIVTEVQHASTSTGIVDDAPGPSRSSVKTRRSKLKDVIPHDPRRASLRGKVGFGSSMSSIATDSSVDKASRPRRKDAADIVRDGRPRARTENPFVLAPRLVEIHRKRGPEQALAELAKSKREARNVAVHNTLIKLLLQDGRMDMAYRVWMDMKRTGLVPTPMSYTVFFSSFRPKGAVSREAEEKLSTVWKQWQAYCEKAADPNDPMHQLARNLEYKVSSTPTNAYIAHIQKSGSQDMSTLSQLVDSLSSTSGVAPTAHTFSVIFRSIITSLPLQSYRDQKEHVTRCYDLCRQTWALMHDKWREGGLQLDALALSAASNAHVQLFRAAPSLFLQADKQRLLQQMEAMIGLERAEDAPETTPARQSRRSNKLDSTVMYDAMVLASAFEGRYSRHVLDWFTALRRHEASLLDARVCEMYMKAAPKSALETLVYMLRSPSTAMRPTLSTYTTAISLSPFIDQVRIIAHMSGRSDLLEASETSLLRTNLEAFQSEKELSKRALEKGYHTKYIQPDKKIMTILLQSALDLQDWRRIDRAVKITTVFLANVVPTDEAHAAEHSKADVYAFRLGENLKEACDRLISNSAVPESRRTELRRSQSRQQTDLKPRLSSLGRGKLART